MTTTPVAWGPPPGGRTGPWSAGNAVAVFAAHALGAGGVLLGWHGASVTADPFDQVVWLVAAGSAVVVAAFSCLAWLLAGRRSVGQRYHALAAAVATTLPASAAVAAPAEAVLAANTDAHGDDDAHPVTGDGMAHFHRPSCVLAVGKRLDAAPRPDHVAAAKRPCPVCTP